MSAQPNSRGQGRSSTSGRDNTRPDSRDRSKQPWTQQYGRDAQRGGPQRRDIHDRERRGGVNRPRSAPVKMVLFDGVTGLDTVPLIERKLEAASTEAGIEAIRDAVEVHMRIQRLSDANSLPFFRGMLYNILANPPERIKHLGNCLSANVLTALRGTLAGVVDHEHLHRLKLETKFNLITMMRITKSCEEQFFEPVFVSLVRDLRRIDIRRGKGAVYFVQLLKYFLTHKKRLAEAYPNIFLAAVMSFLYVFGSFYSPMDIHGNALPLERRSIVIDQGVLIRFVDALREHFDVCFRLRIEFVRSVWNCRFVPMLDDYWTDFINDPKRTSPGIADFLVFPEQMKVSMVNMSIDPWNMSTLEWIVKNVPTGRMRFYIKMYIDKFSKLCSPMLLPEVIRWMILRWEFSQESSVAIMSIFALCNIYKEFSDIGLKMTHALFFSILFRVPSYNENAIRMLDILSGKREDISVFATLVTNIYDILLPNHRFVMAGGTVNYQSNLVTTVFQYGCERVVYDCIHGKHEKSISDRTKGYFESIFYLIATVNKDFANEEKDEIVRHVTTYGLKRQHTIESSFETKKIEDEHIEMDNTDSKRRESVPTQVEMQESGSRRNRDESFPEEDDSHPSKQPKLEELESPMLTYEHNVSEGSKASDGMKIDIGVDMLTSKLDEYTSELNSYEEVTGGMRMNNQKFEDFMKRDFKMALSIYFSAFSIVEPRKKSKRKGTESDVENTTPEANEQKKVLESACKRFIESFKNLFKCFAEIQIFQNDEDIDDLPLIDRVENIKAGIEDAVKINKITRTMTMTSPILNFLDAVDAIFSQDDKPTDKSDTPESSDKPDKSTFFIKFLKDILIERQPQSRSIWLLLWFIDRGRNAKLSKKQSMFGYRSEKWSEFLVKNLNLLFRNMDKEYSYSIIPKIYDQLNKSKRASISILYEVISILDSNQLQKLSAQVRKGEIVMFEDDTLKSIWESVLWKPFEQMCLWELLYSHFIRNYKLVGASKGDMTFETAVLSLIQSKNDLVDDPEGSGSAENTYVTRTSILERNHFIRLVLCTSPIATYGLERLFKVIKKPSNEFLLNLLAEENVCPIFERNEDTKFSNIENIDNFEGVIDRPECDPQSFVAKNAIVNDHDGVWLNLRHRYFIDFRTLIDVWKESDESNLKGALSELIDIIEKRLKEKLESLDKNGDGDANPNSLGWYTDGKMVVKNLSRFIKYVEI